MQQHDCEMLKIMLQNRNMMMNRDINGIGDVFCGNEYVPGIRNNSEWE